MGILAANKLEAYLHRSDNLSGHLRVQVSYAFRNRSCQLLLRIIMISGEEPRAQKLKGNIFRVVIGRDKINFAAYIRVVIIRIRVKGRIRPFVKPVAGALCLKTKVV